MKQTGVRASLLGLFPARTLIPRNSNKYVFKVVKIELTEVKINKWPSNNLHFNAK